MRYYRRVAYGIFKGDLFAAYSKRYSPITARRISKDKGSPPCDESMTSLFSSLLTFYEGNLFQDETTGNLDEEQVFRLYISVY